MQRVFAFRHVPGEHLGRIAPLLEQAGLAWTYVDLPTGDVLPDEPAAGLIFLGGPMSVNDELGYLQQEIRLIERALQAGAPVLGICLGAQLLARALGAQVYRNRVKEIGWFPVTWTPATRDDPLFAGLSGRDTVFHWHGETFDLPAGSAWLASSEACRNQAFRFGECAWGLQFHLEVTPDMIDAWRRQDANCGDARELDAPIDPHLHSDRLRALSGRVFTRWADLIKQKTRL